MADVIVERPSREIVTSDSGAGWAVAVIVIIAIAVAAFVWARYRTPAAVPQNSGASINVTVPDNGTPGGTNTGGTGGTSY
ncbi:MAG: hypothetical protein V4474_01835 [Patescibacteria group bacterium]